MTPRFGRFSRVPTLVLGRREASRSASIPPVEYLPSRHGPRAVTPRTGRSPRGPFGVFRTRRSWLAALAIKVTPPDQSYGAPGIVRLGTFGVSILAASHGKAAANPEPADGKSWEPG